MEESGGQEKGGGSDKPFGGGILYDGQVVAILMWTAVVGRDLFGLGDLGS